MHLRIVRLLLACWLATTVGWAFAADGVVIALAGSVSAERQAQPGTAGASRILRTGDELSQGDLVRTGSDGRAQIRFSDGGLVSLQPRTEFRIDEYEFDGGRQRSFFSLIRGAIRSATGAIGKRDRDNYGLRTPTATIGIRGTEFLAEETVCDPACAPGRRAGLRVSVTEGRIAVTTSAGTLEVGEGEAAEVDSPDAMPRLALTGPVLGPIGLTPPGSTTSQATTETSTPNTTGSTTVPGATTVADATAVPGKATIEGSTTVPDTTTAPAKASVDAQGTDIGTTAGMGIGVGTGTNAVTGTTADTGAIAATRPTAAAVPTASTPSAVLTMKPVSGASTLPKIAPASEEGATAASNDTAEGLPDEAAEAGAAGSGFSVDDLAALVQPFSLAPVGDSIGYNSQRDESGNLIALDSLLPEPGKPVPPGTPGTPGTPDTPDTPGTPGTPGTPDEPDEPDEPGEPDEPDDKRLFVSIVHPRIPGSTSLQFDSRDVRAEFDQAQTLLSVGTCPTFCLSRGSASAVETGYEADVVAWGRWTGGTATLQIGASSSRNVDLSADQGIHYLIGVPSETVPTQGVFTYGLLGATRPTIADGSLAPGSFEGTAAVWFGPAEPARIGLTGTIGIDNAKIGFATRGGTADPSLSELRTGAQYGFSGTLDATVAGGDPAGCAKTGCTVDLRGGLFGPEAARLGYTYTVGGSSASSTIGGAAVFGKK